MRAILFSSILVIFAYISPPLYAQIYNAPSGVGLQGNEGMAAAPAEALAALTNPQDDARDMLGWHRSEIDEGVYAVPANDALEYAQVAASGRHLVLTLFGCDTLAAYECSGPGSFPETPAQIKGFSNWACWVVGAANIPNLRAVTIWNEMNGGFSGGIASPRTRQLAMAKLLMAVVPAIRQCNPNIAIYAGAFIGDSNLAQWFCEIQRFGFNWADVDGLDIHPYLTGNPAKANQNGVNWRGAFLGKNSLSNGCAGATAPIVEPLYFSEWGGAALQKALAKGYFASAGQYFAWFEANVASVSPARYPVVGRDFFLLAADADFPAEGLVSADFSQLTAIGEDYQAAYVVP